MLSTAPSQTEARPQQRRPPAPVLNLAPAVAASTVGGFLLDVAFPSVGWWPVVFLSVPLALVALIGRTVSGAALVGFSYGAAFSFAHLVWIGEFLGPLPWVALAVLQSALVAFGAVLITLTYRWLPELAPGRVGQLLLTPVVVAAIWTGRELLAGAWPYSGFPWARLGMTQVESRLAELVSWTGVTGLSFVLVWAGAVIIEGFRHAPPVRLAMLGGLTAVLTLIALVPQFPTVTAGTFRIGWVQGDGPAGYFDARRPGDIFTAQEEATEPLLGTRMDLLVWPEGSVDGDAVNDPAVASRLDRLATQTGAPLLVNGATARDGRTFNTTLLWGDGNDAGPQLHDKVNPVPFGEYVPDRWFYELLVPNLTELIQREYSPGNNPPLVDVGGTPLGLAICFDVIYDDVIRAGAVGGAQAYVFQTNNADFRGTDENLQQLAFARMRAIETGRAVVNVSTVGTSQAIGPDGSVLDTLPADEPGARVTTVPLRTGVTAGTILAPWAEWTIGVAGIFVLGFAGLVRARKRNENRRTTG